MLTCDSADPVVELVDTCRHAVDLELTAEAIPHIVWMTGPDGLTEYFNRRGTDYTGLPASANYGWEWVNLIHPDDADSARRGWGHAIRTQTSFRMEYRIRRYDGEFRWHAFRGDPLLDPNGHVIKWIGTATDIEDARRAQRSLERSEREAAELATLLDTLQETAPIGIGFVDRDFRLIRVNAALAEVNGASAESHVGRLVSDVIPEIWPKVASLYHHVLDTGEPVVNQEVSGLTASDPSRSHHWLTSYYPVPLGGEIIGIGIIVVDVTERKEADEARDRLTHAAVAAMAATVEAKDPYTAGHEFRVADISAAIARDLGLREFDIEGITLAAQIHDLGKIGVPAEILARPGQLRAAEFDLVRTHSQIGFDIVKGIDFPWPVAEMILRHHERCDGSGYPDELRGNKIVLGARIIAVADTVEAMASHRPYRAALGLDAALAQIQDGRGTLFDADVVDACVTLFRTGRLSLGEQLNATAVRRPAP